MTKETSEKNCRGRLTKDTVKGINYGKNKSRNRRIKTNDNIWQNRKTLHTVNNTHQSIVHKKGGECWLKFRKIKK